MKKVNSLAECVNVKKSYPGWTFLGFFLSIITFMYVFKKSYIKYFLHQNYLIVKRMEQYLTEHPESLPVPQEIYEFDDLYIYHYYFDVDGITHMIFGMKRKDIGSMKFNTTWSIFKNYKKDVTVGEIILSSYTSDTEDYYISYNKVGDLLSDNAIKFPVTERVECSWYK